MKDSTNKHGQHDIAILIPCRNEERSIGKVVEDFRDALPDAAIYVFDNQSDDNTAQAAHRAGAHVRQEEIPGKGNVVRRMFRDVEADIYIIVDGDDTYDATSAPHMVETLVQGHYDLVNGVRRTREDTTAAYRPGHRFGNTLFTRLIGLLFGNSIRDVLSGYKVLSRRFVKSFPVNARGFEIEVELAIHALELSVPIAHVETAYGSRHEDSSSKLRTHRDGARILWVFTTLIKQERPLLFFSVIGAVLAAISIALAVPIFLEYANTGLVPRFPTAILSTGIMLLAWLSFFSGIILDTVSRGRREAKALHYLACGSNSCRRDYGGKTANNHNMR